MKIIGLIIIVLLSFNTIVEGQNIYKTIPALEFNEKAKDAKFTVIDLRTEREFKEGHIPGAINIDLYDTRFDQMISTFKSRPVLIYARSSAQSKQAMDKLISLKFKEVYELDNGLVAWRRANLPLVK